MKIRVSCCLISSDEVSIASDRVEITHLDTESFERLLGVNRNGKKSNRLRSERNQVDEEGEGKHIRDIGQLCSKSRT